MELAAFLLREAFGHDYAAIAEIVGKSEANCRQMVSRAKARLGRAEEPKPTASEEVERLVKEFLHATQTGELADLMSLLTDDAILYSDGGGKVRARVSAYVDLYVFGQPKQRLPRLTIRKIIQSNAVAFSVEAPHACNKTKKRTGLPLGDLPAYSEARPVALGRTPQ